MNPWRSTGTTLLMSAALKRIAGMVFHDWLMCLLKVYKSTVVINCVRLISPSEVMKEQKHRDVVNVNSRPVEGCPLNRSLYS